MLVLLKIPRAAGFYEIFLGEKNLRMLVKSPSFAHHVYVFATVGYDKKIRMRRYYVARKWKIGNSCSRYKTCFPIDCRV